jgi:2,5-diketo-D-gluconate reductase A
MTIPQRSLSDGNAIPAIGLGTFGLKGEAGITSIVSGIEAGFRLLDTGLRYENECEVGEGMRRSGVDRSELIVTTKLRGRDHGYAETLRGFEESRGNLGLDYVDLYLIHWPLPRVDKYVDSWRAMIAMQAQGVIRSIGVSNFTPAQVSRLIDETGVTPVVNQVELHPQFGQADLLAFDDSLGIVTEAWSPIGAHLVKITDAPEVVSIALAHSVTPTQVVLRWHVQRGAVPIPKSGNPARQRENLDVFGFELTDADVAAISRLECGRLWDADPDTHEEF